MFGVDSKGKTISQPVITTKYMKYLLEYTRNQLLRRVVDIVILKFVRVDKADHDNHQENDLKKFAHDSYTKFLSSDYS